MRAQVCTALAKDRPAEFAAQRVLPLLTPLLVADSLTAEVFAHFMRSVRDLLEHIERKRAAAPGIGAAAAVVAWDEGASPTAVVATVTPIPPSTSTPAVAQVQAQARVQVQAQSQAQSQVQSRALKQAQVQAQMQPRRQQQPAPAPAAKREASPADFGSWHGAQPAAAATPVSSDGWGWGNDDDDLFSSPSPAAAAAPAAAASGRPAASVSDSWDGAAPAVTVSSSQQPQLPMRSPMAMNGRGGAKAMRPAMGARGRGSSGNASAVLRTASGGQASGGQAAGGAGGPMRMSSAGARQSQSTSGLLGADATPANAPSAADDLFSGLSMGPSGGGAAVPLAAAPKAAGIASSRTRPGLAGAVGRGGVNGVGTRSTPPAAEPLQPPLEQEAPDLFSLLDHVPPPSASNADPFANLAGGW